jgi:hypothetical protein
VGESVSAVSEDRQVRIAQLASMKEHLADMSLLTGREVSRYELLPLNRTLEIKGLIPSAMRANKRIFEVSFSELTSARLHHYVNQLAAVAARSVYLWTHLSYTCGLLELPSLTNIKLDFAFNAMPSGIFTVMTSDLKEAVTFDRYEEDHREIVQVIAEGEIWPTIRHFGLVKAPSVPRLVPKPDETLLAGKDLDSRYRIDQLTRMYFQKIAETDDRSFQLFKDPEDGRLWERHFPEGAGHGGGPPRLRTIDAQEALERYGWSEE